MKASALLHELAAARVTVEVVGQASRLSAGRLALGANNAGETPGAAGETPAPLPEESRSGMIVGAQRFRTLEGEGVAPQFVADDHPAVGPGADVDGRAGA